MVRTLQRCCVQWGKALQKPAVVKSVLAAFLGMMGGKSHSAIYTTTILKDKVAAVSVSILLISSFQMESLLELF